MRSEPTTVQLLTIAALLGTTPSALRAQHKPRKATQPVVASGEMVDVVFQEQSVTVTTKGRATRAARKGERISVEIDAESVIEGLVVAPGLVKVD
jgi:flagella basal body P-ring formation protein FlgA